MKHIMKRTQEIITRQPRIEQILQPWSEQIGADYAGYRGHVYRMFNCCLALHDCNAEDIDKLAIAAAFHDIGLWTDATVDYLEPSARQAQRWLQANQLAHGSDEIIEMIVQHHKVRPYRDHAGPLVELFRRGDLVDFSLGLIRFGLPVSYLFRLQRAIPNAGFHRFLLKGARDWFKAHPFSPPPFMRW